MDLNHLLHGAYDMHIHTAPDVTPRKCDDLELAQRLWDTQPTSPRPLGDEALEAFCRRAAEQEVEGLA